MKEKWIEWKAIRKITKFTEEEEERRKNEI
jgi:hypothetical protein